MNGLVERLKEPSSWAGLGGLLAMVGVSLDPGVLHGLSLVGAGLAWVAAFLMPEQK